jgi:LysR family transcriptional regulator, transcriptional activator of the cysJI operon
MQIETFQIFCDLVETASFSRAAEIHGITQSAVSQQIRALELKFHVTLIERGKKHFSVTEEGRAMLRAAKEILAAYHSLGERISELRTSVSGRMRIASVHSIGLHELPPFLKIYRQKFPEMDVTLEFLRSAQVYQSVLDGGADLGLVAFPAKRKGLEVESFWRDRLVLICHPGHRLGTRERIRLKDIDGERFVSFSYDQPTRKAIDHLLAVDGVKIQIAMEFDNIETVKRVVEIESGVAIVPRAAVKEEVRAGTLAAVEITGADMWRPLGLVIKKSKALSPGQSAFISLLRSAKKEF